MHSMFLATDIVHLLQTALAMCTVLAVTLTRVPNSVLRSKFVGSVQLLGRVVELHKQQVEASSCIKASSIDDRSPCFAYSANPEALPNASIWIISSVWHLSCSAVQPDFSMRIITRSDAFDSSDML